MLVLRIVNTAVLEPNLMISIRHSCHDDMVYRLAIEGLVELVRYGSVHKYRADMDLAGMCLVDMCLVDMDLVDMGLVDLGLVDKGLVDMVSAAQILFELEVAAQHNYPAHLEFDLVRLERSANWVRLVLGLAVIYFEVHLQPIVASLVNYLISIVRRVLRAGIQKFEVLDLHSHYTAAMQLKRLLTSYLSIN